MFGAHTDQRPRAALAPEVRQRVGAEDLGSVHDGQAVDRRFEGQRRASMAVRKQGRGKVADDIARALAAHWSDAAVVEITVLIGTTMMLNRLCTGLELPVSDETVQRLHAEGFSV